MTSAVTTEAASTDVGTTNAVTPAPAMRIVITECDHDSFAAEHLVTDPAGADDADVEPGGSLRSHRQVTHARNASASTQHVAFDP